jgi:hypothetical protein
VSGTLRAVALKRGDNRREGIGAGTMRSSWMRYHILRIEMQEQLRTPTEEQPEKGNHPDPVRQLQTALERFCDAQIRLLPSLIDKRVLPQRLISPNNRKISP